MSLPPPWPKQGHGPSQVQRAGKCNPIMCSSGWESGSGTNDVHIKGLPKSGAVDTQCYPIINI